MNPMSKLGALAALAALLMASGLACAQDWLPPEQVARESILGHPANAAAMAAQGGQYARAEAIRTGPAETQLRLTPQYRRVRDPSDNFAEGQIGVERPLRLWGKADADAALADATIQSADIGLQDARHELSRELLGLWFGALRARTEVQAQSNALEQATDLVRIVKSRVRHGDAAVLDLQLASSDMERSRAAALAAQAGERSAVAAIRARFPLVRLPDGVPQRLPADIDGDRVGLRQAYIEASHELRLARAEGERVQQLARRVGLERYPDPMVGAFVSIERGGAERVAGVNLIVPLGGSYRRANAQAAAADATHAAARYSQAERKAESEFDLQWELMQGNRQAADAMLAASAQQGAAYDKVRRAYAMGEAGVADVLAAKRARDEVQRQASLAVIDAAQSRYRLELDLHRLWDFDE
jgi:outer membrane protein TolC